MTSNAATVTATIDSWNTASLSGDVTPAMKVEYLSTAKSSTQVTADHSAYFSLFGLPACTIDAITMFVRSNSKSGAAMVMMSLGNSTRLVASGSYEQWPNMMDYSTTAQPLVCLQQACEVTRRDTIKLQIDGMVNSVYVEKIVVDYTLTPAVPYTVTLQWLDSKGVIRTQQLTEPFAESGVELPSIGEQDSVLERGGETWYWVGWCEQSIDKQCSSPLCWQTNDWYAPEDHCTLYALYTDTPEQIIRQDSSFTSGDYMLCYHVPPVGGSSEMLALAGKWVEGKIDMKYMPFEQTMQGDWQWSINHLEDVYRYHLDFTDDSVSICHTQSQTYIGHTKTSGSNKQTKWAWGKAYQGTILLYGEKKEETIAQYMCMTIENDGDFDAYCATYRKEEYAPSDLQWLLFPVDAIPSTSEDISYTTFREVTSIRTSTPDAPTNRKWLDDKGRIMISTKQRMYSVMGHIL